MDRSFGPVKTTTRTPEGSRKGGSRLGELEREAFMSLPEDTEAQRKRKQYLLDSLRPEVDYNGEQFDLLRQSQAF